MYRHAFSSDEVADLVMKVIGEIEPVGETNTDDARYVHLQILLKTLDILIDEVTFVAAPGETYFLGVVAHKAECEARAWLEEKYWQFSDNLGKGEENGRSDQP